MFNIEEIKKEVFFIAVRSRGPGGQNVNKVSSAAVLYWNVYLSKGITAPQMDLIAFKLAHHINKEKCLWVRSDEFRDLERNKARCFEKLIEMLRNSLHKPKKRKATKPTKASKKRAFESKSRRSETKRLRQRIS